MATFPPAELQYQLDHQGDDESRQLAAFFIVCMVLSAFFVAVRLVSRKLMKLGLQVDDYTILAGLVRMSYADLNGHTESYSQLLDHCRGIIHHLAHLWSATLRLSKPRLL